jgi:hypothetical protein
VKLERRDGYLLLVGGPVPRGADAITIGPLISLREASKDSAYLLRHELVHVRQWRRHGVVGFALRYTGDYLRNRLRGYGHWGAYRRIGFEIEADWVARRTLRAGLADEIGADDGAATHGSGRTDQVG